jgi:ElaB/YqjD/DUF883 family membrane-anchored ribosome-binding protein
VNTQQTDSLAPATGSAEEEKKAVMTGDEILERMAVVRLRLDEHADEVAAQVNALGDWRSYVRRHPWLAVSAAAALGFVVVPAKKKPGAGGSGEASSGQRSAFAADQLRSVVIGAAKKAATAYAGRTLGAVVESFVAADRTPR